MRICIITSAKFPPEEGIGNFIYNMSKIYLKAGHNVTIITRGDMGKTKTKLYDGICIYQVPYVPLYPFHIALHGYFVNSLIKKIEGNYDIIHIHSPLTPNPSTSLPIISTIHTSLVEDAKHLEVVDVKSAGTKILTKVISYPLILELVKKSRKVTTVSSSVKDEIKKYYNYGDSLVVGNGVDESVFTPLGVKSDEKYILYVGRLSYRKGLFDLLDCAKTVTQKYNIKFLIIGKGELEKKLREKIRENGLGDKVILLGHVKRDELIRIYQNSMVFVMPSHYEGLPTTLLEAMSCGIPVVATSVSGNLDVIENGKNGLLVPANSPDKLACAVSDILENDVLRINLGKEARTTIESKFTWNMIANKIYDCYLSILKMETVKE